jgi:pseudo-rSAM protein
MIFEKTGIDYWFTIDPYVYVGLTQQDALLYNILDGSTIESNKVEVVELLREMLQKENLGVAFLPEERWQNDNIKSFIREIREKYMGDIIDVTLSMSKPVQLLPFFNFPNPDKFEIYKKQNFPQKTNIFEKLSEICIHVDRTSNIEKLILFFQSLPTIPMINIVGDIWGVENYVELLSFLNRYPSPKTISCSYTHALVLQASFENNFSYKILVQFPIDMQQWNISRQILLHQTLPFEYVFEVTSVEDCMHVEQLVEQYQIEEYRLNPVYTGENIRFFEENIFLTKEEILSTTLSLKDFFTRQEMNIYDFGKINIMPNGDAYANVNYPVLGNIYAHSIYEILCKEIEEGMSWFRIRCQVPCNNCVYQWLCPSPSNYEIAIGRPNLCHVNN